MRILVTGASGQLGAYLIRRFNVAGHEVRAWSASQSGERDGVRLEPVDLAVEAEARAALEAANPDAVVHAAAVANAVAVWKAPERARAVNVAATQWLAQWCGERDRRLLFISTDLVFDGAKAWNRESDPARPTLEYGRTKLAAEAFALEVSAGIVARCGLLYGGSRCDRPTFFDAALAALERGEPRAYFEDEYRTPLHYATAAIILERLLRSTATGLVHVGGRERLSRYELCQSVAAALGYPSELVLRNRQRDVPAPEPRPADVSLDTTRLMRLVPDLERPDVAESIARNRNGGTWANPER